MRLVLLALLPACSLYFGDGEVVSETCEKDCGIGGTGSGLLRKVKAIAGEHAVAGIDVDGQGGLWIAYRDQVGDYYTLADVWITHLDANGVKLSEWHYKDDYTQIGGIAYTGDALWLNYNAVGVANCHVRKIDPSTGDTLATFATMNGITDVTRSDDGIVLSYKWNELRFMNTATGAIDSTSITAFDDGGIQRGIAWDDGEFWVFLLFRDVIHKVDRDGNVLSAWAVPPLPQINTVETRGGQLAWDGNHLIIVAGNQIIWLAPQ